MSEGTITKPRVLLVEDDRTNRYAMSRLLSSFGLEVQEAQSIDQAIIHLSPALHFIVLDWLMPEGDSAHIIEQARAKAPDSRIAVVTVAHDRCEEIRRYLPDAIFTKPFSPSALQNWFAQHDQTLSDSQSN